jgi:DNA-directed RNA polymerase subunit RPC12/RpoP
MPAYSCSACGGMTEVPNTRGSRIRGRACAHCGAEGTLHGATAGRPSKHEGKTYERCAACGKRGLRHAHPAFAWEPKWSVTADQGPHPSSSPACWTCEPVPAARTRHATLHAQLEQRWGSRRLRGSWAGDTEQAALALDAAAVDGWTCRVCGDLEIPGGWSSAQFLMSYPRFERGIAAVADCQRCGHSVLLAEGPPPPLQEVKR